MIGRVNVRKDKPKQKVSHTGQSVRYAFFLPRKKERKIDEGLKYSISLQTESGGEGRGR